MRKITFSLLLLVLVLGVAVTAALADGTETLGEPLGVVIADGSGIAVGGSGLHLAQPGTIEVTVPAGATVKQVLLYWSGEFRTAGANHGTITVDGSTVAGTPIGGPAYFYTFEGRVYVEAFRADITSDVAFGPGLNSVDVGGLDFVPSNNGAGILVIYDDGTTTSEIGIRDGVDLAYIGFPDPRKLTVPQTFTFAPEGTERVADLAIFAGSVGEEDRPNAIAITVGGVTTKEINPLFGADGQLWDSLVLPVTIPADADSVTVEVLSERDDSSNNPASLSWIGAALSVPVTPPPPPGGGEGCTPGYWKTKKHQDDWAATGYDQEDDFDATFGVNFFDPDIMLFEAVWARGGQEKRAARHGTAALLNASHPEVSFDLTVDEVIEAVQLGHIDLLEQYNEQETPGFCD